MTRKYPVALQAKMFNKIYVLKMLYTLAAAATRISVTHIHKITEIGCHFHPFPIYGAQNKCRIMNAKHKAIIFQSQYT